MTLPMMPLSGDPPRSMVLTVALMVIVTALALAPFLFPGSKPLNVAAKICIFIALAASYDLLLGYTGVVSFAHTMFYGIGSYGIAIALYGLGPRWDAIALGLAVALPLAALLALVIGLFSLRVQTIFFAMITLAVASAFAVLASQLSWLTGGEDGRSFRVPELLRPGTNLGSLFGIADHRPHAHLLHRVRRLRGAVPDAAAHRQLAVRARAAGDPRESVPRRSARLSHRDPPHARERASRPLSPPPSARSMRSGCATPVRTRRSPSTSCSTSC